jgi:hypothetical protein
MSCVFQNIFPHPPLRPASVYPPSLLTHSPGEEGGGGQYWKTQDTALIYASMIFTAPCVIILMRAASITCASGKGFGPVKWHRADRRVPFGHSWASASRSMPPVSASYISVRYRTGSSYSGTRLVPASAFLFIPVPD